MTDKPAPPTKILAGMVETPPPQPMVMDQIRPMPSNYSGYKTLCVYAHFVKAFRRSRQYDENK